MLSSFILIQGSIRISSVIESSEIYYHVIYFGDDIDIGKAFSDSEKFKFIRQSRYQLDYFPLSKKTFPFKI